MVRIARGEEVVDSAMQVIANAVTVEQLRQAQAVVLPLRFAMSLEQTAEVTGLSVGWVSKQRNRFIQGKAVGDGTVPARGGRRRLCVARLVHAASQACGDARAGVPDQ